MTTLTDAALKTTTYSYDLMSNLTGTTDALSHTTNYEYDEFNRLIKTMYPPAVIGGARLQETVEYDAAGNVTKRTDTAGRITTLGYDNANRLVTATDPALQITQYEYNPRSNATAVVDALGQRYTFDYDALSRVTTATRAGLQMSFVYDAVGNRAQRTDFNNMTTGYTYNELNRLTKITYPDASTVNYGYDNLSQLTSAANINGTVSFVYDSLGRATSTTDVWGQVLNYTYDANDRRTKLSFGAITNATYAYDVVNRLTKITDSANLAVNYVYDATSKLTSKTMPNGVAATYTYDGLDRLTRLKDAKGNTVIADNQYSYNTAGDITQNIDQSGTHGYGYDAIDRLTSATYTGTPNESYAYDGVGNRTSSHRSATYGYQPFNRLTNTVTASYIYNNNGNMISKTEGTGTTQFVWDFENRLVQVVTPTSGSVTYKYDALGRRIQRTPSTGVSTNFIYDGQDVVKDINSDGTTVEYLNGPGVDNKIRQKGSSTSTTYYFSQDHLSSTTALTGTTGKLVERITYDAYGNSTGSTRTRYGYTGRERDQLSGQLYYRARFYDPQLGRFISEDPIGLSGGMNFYNYVGSNPVNALDPFGLSSILVLVGPRSNGGSGGAYIMLLDKNGKRIPFRNCGCDDPDVASGHAVAKDPNRMLREGVGDTPFGVYNYTGTQGGTPQWRDPKNPDGFGTGKILLKEIYGEVVDARRNLIRLHGGGSGLADPYKLDQELRPTQGCVRMKNGEVNSLIEAIKTLPADDPLEFVFIGDDSYLNSLATDSSLANRRWQPVLRTNFGLPAGPH